MHELLRFLSHYGYVVVFAWVLAEQLGLPVPATPLLLAAGALAGHGSFHLASALVVAVGACLFADLFWFYVGRKGGGKVLKLICRVSLEPDSCVRRTSTTIGKHGPKSLLVTKFIPGMNAVAAPLAGSGGISLVRFVVFDGLGALLWSATFLGIGYLFREQLEVVAERLGQFSWLLLILLLIVIPVAYILYKHKARQKFIRDLWTDRIMPDDLNAKIAAGDPVTVVDLRHPLDFLPDPRVIPHALRILPEELESRYQEIPGDHEVVLYCT